MRIRAALLAVCFTMALGATASAQRPALESHRQAAAKPAPPAPRPTAPAPDDQQRALVRQLADAQKWAGEQLWAVKEAVDALPDTLNLLKEQVAAQDDEVRKLRDEVKGLYVELASLREQLEAARGEVAGVDSNVSSFRAFSGFFIAAMILALAVITVMTLRR